MQSDGTRPEPQPDRRHRDAPATSSPCVQDERRKAWEPLQPPEREELARRIAADLIARKAMRLYERRTGRQVPAPPRDPI